MRYLLHYKWSLAWVVLVLFLLLTPSNDMPDLNRFNLFPGTDKVVHLGIFFILAILIYVESAIKSGWSQSRWKTMVKVVLSTVVFAALTEEAQLHISSRSRDIMDLLADCIGIGMATFAYLLIYRKKDEKSNIGTEYDR